jgi:hypothetical protein
MRRVPRNNAESFMFRDVIRPVLEIWVDILLLFELRFIGEFTWSSVRLSVGPWVCWTAVSIISAKFSQLHKYLSNRLVESELSFMKDNE